MRATLLPSVVVCLAACVTSSGTSSRSRLDRLSPGASLGVVDRHNMIDAVELSQLPGTMTAYAALQYARPFFLRPRPGSVGPLIPAPGINVFVNDLPAGDLETLRLISVEHIASMHFMQPTEARVRLGPTYAGAGVIMVTLKR